MDPRFQIGEKIDAHIPGLIVKAVETDEHSEHDATWVDLTYCAMWPGHSDEVTFSLSLPVGAGIEFQRITPADGEPQPGELWADRVDNLYFVQLGPSGGSAWLVDADVPTSGGPWEDVHRSTDGPIYRVAQRPLIGGQS